MKDSSRCRSIASRFFFFAPLFSPHVELLTLLRFFPCFPLCLLKLALLLWANSSIALSSFVLEPLGSLIIVSIRVAFQSLSQSSFLTGTKMYSTVRSGNGVIPSLDVNFNFRELSIRLSWSQRDGIKRRNAGFLVVRSTNLVYADLAIFDKCLSNNGKVYDIVQKLIQSWYKSKRHYAAFATFWNFKIYSYLILAHSQNWGFHEASEKLSFKVKSSAIKIHTKCGVNLR